MKKALIAIVVLALIGGGAWFLFRPKSNPSTSSNSSASTPINTGQSSQNSTPKAATNTVTFDGTFSPATLTVKAGTKVTFVNNSDADFWPASNPHPTHTDLPGFDSKQSLGKGQSYSFTFTKVGTWGYHNHLSSDEGGTIVVE